LTAGDIHTQPYGARWANHVEGHSRVSNVHDTKKQAEREGREMAIRRKVEHLIHKQNGNIGERNSYGGDPPRQPG
jgi:Uncharacterized protein conserved in bacteria (DUF2188)